MLNSVIKQCLINKAMLNYAKRKCLIKGDDIMARKKDVYPFGHKQVSIDLDPTNEAILKQIQVDTSKSRSYIVNAILEYYYSNVYDNSIYTNYTLGKLCPRAEN